MTPHEANQLLWEGVSLLDCGQIAQALASGADPNSVFSSVGFDYGVGVDIRDDWTPLMACLHPDTAQLHLSGLRREEQFIEMGRAIELLLQHGADPNLVFTVSPCTLLMHACGVDASNPVLAQAMNKLIAHSSADIVRRMDIGNQETALHIAARKCRVEQVRALLAAGADPNAIDRVGDTPLWALAREEHYKSALASMQSEDTIAQLLLNAGAIVGPHPESGHSILMECRNLDMDKWEDRGVDLFYDRDGLDLRWIYMYAITEFPGGGGEPECARLLTLMQRGGINWDARHPVLGQTLLERLEEKYALNTHNAALAHVFEQLTRLRAHQTLEHTTVARLTPWARPRI